MTHRLPVQRRLRHALALALAAAALPAAATTTTLSFQQGLGGYAGQFDTGLSASEPDLLLADAQELSIDASDGGAPAQALLRFDGLFGNAPGQIGAGDTITSATLTLQITSAGSGILFHELLQPIDFGTVTWNLAGNGIQTDGVEARVAPLISLGANTGDGNIEEGTLVLDFTEALRRAQAGQVPFGWALLPWIPDGTNGVDFYTAEWSEVAARPLLTVQVSPVPEPASLALMLGGVAALLLARGRRG